MIFDLDFALTSKIVFVDGSFCGCKHCNSKFPIYMSRLLFALVVVLLLSLSLVSALKDIPPRARSGTAFRSRFQNQLAQQRFQSRNQTAGLNVMADTTSLGPVGFTIMIDYAPSTSCQGTVRSGWVLRVGTCLVMEDGTSVANIADTTSSASDILFYFNSYSDGACTNLSDSDSDYAMAVM